MFKHLFNLKHDIANTYCNIEAYDNRGEAIKPFGTYFGLFHITFIIKTMKKLKYLILLVAMAASFSSCVVRAHGGVYLRGHD